MLLGSGDIAAAVGLTTGAVRAWIRATKFPDGVRPGGKGHRRWKAEEVIPILRAWGYEIPSTWTQADKVAA